MTTERQVQVAVADYMDRHSFFRDFWLHVPNERSDKVQAALLKREGVKAGVPDILVIRPARGFVGMALELKRPNAPPSSLSQAQRMWLEQFDRMGWYATVAKGVDAALEKLRWYALGAEQPVDRMVREARARMG